MGSWYRFSFIVRLTIVTLIDRDVSTACRSSSGDSIDLLSRNIFTAVVVSDWCITNLAHGWWVSIQNIVGIMRGRNWSAQRSAAVEIGCHVESDCRHPLLRNLNTTVPVDVVRVKSYVNSLLSSTTVPVRVSVNKLNPERILLGLRSKVWGLIGVFRNGRSLSLWKLYSIQPLFKNLYIVLQRGYHHARRLLVNKMNKI